MSEYVIRDGENPKKFYSTLEKISLGGRIWFWSDSIRDALRFPTANDATDMMSHHNLSGEISLYEREKNLEEYDILNQVDELSTV